MEIDISQLSKERGEWYLRNGEAAPFGPVSWGGLKTWVREGRLGPDSEISTDCRSWIRARSVGELGMRWLVTLPQGGFYGPIHHDAAVELLHNGEKNGPMSLYCLAGPEAGEKDVPTAGEFDKLCRDLSAARARIKSLEELNLRDKTAYEADGKRLRREVEVLLSAREEFKKERESLRRTERSLLEDLQALKQEGERERSILAERNAELGHTLEKLQREGETFKATLAQKSEENRLLSSRNRELTEKIGHLSAECSRLKERSAKAESELLETGRRSSLLEEKLRSEREGSRAKIEELSTLNETLEKQLREAEEAFNIGEKGEAGRGGGEPFRSSGFSRGGPSASREDEVIEGDILSIEMGEVEPLEEERGTESRSTREGGFRSKSLADIERQLQWELSQLGKGPNAFFR